MDVTPDSHPGDGWLPLAEAAARLGLSRDALRRRIRRGTIPSRQVQTRYGPTYEVQIAEASATLADGDRHPDGRNLGTSATVTPASLAEFATLVRDLSERSERNAAAAAMWQARAELLGLQLQQAQERILALEAPREPTPADMTTGRESEGLMGEPSGAPPGPEQATSASAAPARRPWWLRWLPA